jgi:hypothetical protein
MEGQVSKAHQSTLDNEDVGERWVANVALELEDGHFADGILIAPQTLHQFGDIDSVHDLWLGTSPSSLVLG